MLKIKLSFLIISVIFLPLHAQKADPTFSAAIARLQERLDEITAFPSRHSKGIYFYHLLEGIEVDCKKLRHGDVNPQLEMVYANCLSAEGKYLQANQVLHLASLQYPSNTRLQRSFEKANQLNIAAEHIMGLLPSGNKLLSVEAIDSTNYHWIALSASLNHNAYGYEFQSIKLTLFDTSGLMTEKTAETHELSEDVISLPASNGLRLILQRLKSKEMYAHLLFYHLGASWLPCSMRVFRVSPREIKPAGSMFASEPIWMQDINHDSVWDCCVTHEIGFNVAHVEQPRWTDYYTLQNGSYKIANELFSSEFKSWPAILEQAVRSHKNDCELLCYLGESYRLTYQPAKANSAYLKANVECHRAMNEEEDAYTKESLKKIENRIVHGLALLK